MAGGGKSEGGWTVADVDGVDSLTVFDGVDGDLLGVEVGDVEQRIVGCDEAANWIGAHDVGTCNFVCAGIDLGDRIGEGVGDEDFAAVGLEGQMNRAAADVEQGLESILDCRGRLRMYGAGEQNRHDLVTTTASREGLGGVGQNDDVAGCRASLDHSAHFACGWIDDADGVACAIGDYY